MFQNLKRSHNLLPLYFTCVLDVWGFFFGCREIKKTFTFTVAAFHCCARWLRLVIWGNMMFMINEKGQCTLIHTWICQIQPHQSQKHQQTSKDKCSFCGNSRAALFLFGSYCKIIVIITESLNLFVWEKQQCVLSCLFPTLNCPVHAPTGA